MDQSIIWDNTPTQLLKEMRWHNSSRNRCDGMSEWVSKWVMDKVSYVKSSLVKITALHIKVIEVSFLALLIIR